LFFQVSVYSRRGARVDHLSLVFAKGKHTSLIQNFRSDAEKICQRDEDEAEEQHGQRVGKIFHDADFIVSIDIQTPSVSEQVTRFCDLLFSSNAVSPSMMEYGLFLAKAAALRTLDLSRQVGAAIFSDNGQIIALGSNEVPKAGGGTYWVNENWDDRDFRRGYDSNDHRKREILEELMRSLGCSDTIESALSRKEITDSQFMDALEYGRIVHAEMNAISDAARAGRSTNGAILYCTTFPCHMCAKHIVASGIARVIFLEPYPKSLASELHRDSISVERGDRGKYNEAPSVAFEHFFGISPRRYRELFERTRRKDKNGNFVPFGNGHPVPIIDLKFPFYQQLERLIIKDCSDLLALASADREKETLNLRQQVPSRSSTQRAKRKRLKSS
jgi:deoxycytidylate deaminase